MNALIKMHGLRDASLLVFIWITACFTLLGWPREATAKPVGKRLARKDATALNQPAKGFRYWAPFQATPIRYDYVAGVCREGEITYYMGCADFKRPAEKSIMIAFPPGGERDLRKIKVLFSTQLISDVYDPAKKDQLAKPIQMARTTMHYDAVRGFVSMQSLFPGKASDYAKRSLVPAIFSSPSGEPGSWTYHGKLSGEPAAYENKMKAEGKRWIGEGSIVPVGDNRWRAYLGGYGAALAVAESDSLDGPWTFVKERNGKIKDLVAGLMKAKGCFPYVLKVSDREYHLWITEAWPVGPVWHFTSENGLNFRPYGTQPEITLAAAQSKSMKGIRAFYCPESNLIYGLIPFASGPGWLIYQSTLPAGLQPENR